MTYPDIDDQLDVLGFCLFPTQVYTYICLDPALWATHLAPPEVVCCWGCGPDPGYAGRARLPVVC